jgi:uncharacterized protein (TIGR00299 family) protein
MPVERLAVIDPAAGISGDMLLGALLSAGAPREWLTGLPLRLGMPGVSVEIAEVDRCGVSAVKATVRLPGGRTEEPAAERTPSEPYYVAPEERASHPHRLVGDIIEGIRRAPLSEWVRGRAVRAFELLAEAEGHIHGVSAERVALHEVGALDAIIDVVGAIEGFEQLGISKIYARPVALGSGWVTAAHGVLPIPAPATLRLLEGGDLDIGPDGPVVGEATTPTGAVLLRVLSRGRPPARWRPVASGWGAGGRDPEHYPNALRLIVAEPVADLSEVVTLATDLDDLSPEYVEPLREALVLAGALDVQVWTTHMKKGRVGFRVEALVRPADTDRVCEALFRHSSTAGVRASRSERVTLARRHIEVETANGQRVRVKVLDGPDGPRVKPEYDDVIAVAHAEGRPAFEIARELSERALSLVSPNASHGPPAENKE